MSIDLRFETSRVFTCHRALLIARFVLDDKKTKTRELLTGPIRTVKHVCISQRGTIWFMRHILTISLLVTVACDAVSAADDEQRLNILLITSDDLGLQLSCYGDKVIQTPNLDRLAGGGVQFDVAYIAQASCSPSRSAMFTGLYPHTNGQYGLANRGFQMHARYHKATLPAFLKNAGYRTGIIGKLHVAPEKVFPFDDRPKVNTRRVRDVARAAKAFLANDGPFFLMVNYSDPHAYRENRQSRDWYFPAQIDGVPEKPIKPGDAPPWPFQGIDEPEQLKKVANYYNCVLRLDAGVGMLLDALEKSGHADDTLVIFVGDHGPPFARGKTTCYEAGLRVPFIVRWPGVSKPMKSAAMVSTVDILPTILDAAGVALPKELHGRSLRAAVSNADAPWREYLAGEFHFHGSTPFFPRRAIRDGRYKLIHNLTAGRTKPGIGIDGDRAYSLSQQPKYQDTPTRRAFNTFADPPEFELYDLRTDPHEMNNIAGKAESVETLKRMKAALAQWRRQTDDPFLDPVFVERVGKGK